MADVPSSSPRSWLLLASGTPPSPAPLPPGRCSVLAPRLCLGPLSSSASPTHSPGDLSQSSLPSVCRRLPGTPDSNSQRPTDISVRLSKKPPRTQRLPKQTPHISSHPASPLEVPISLSGNLILPVAPAKSPGSILDSARTLVLSLLLSPSLSAINLSTNPVLSFTFNFYPEQPFLTISAQATSRAHHLTPGLFQQPPSGPLLLLVAPCNQKGKVTLHTSPPNCSTAPAPLSSPGPATGPQGSIPHSSPLNTHYHPAPPLSLGRRQHGFLAREVRSPLSV